jgi:hypothetical protein
VLAAIFSTLICGSLFLMIAFPAGKRLKLEFAAKLRIRRAPAYKHFRAALLASWAIIGTKMANGHKWNCSIYRSANLFSIEHIPMWPPIGLAVILQIRFYKRSD